MIYLVNFIFFILWSLLVYIGTHNHFQNNTLLVLCCLCFPVLTIWYWIPFLRNTIYLQPLRPTMMYIQQSCRASERSMLVDFAESTSNFLSFSNSFSYLHDVTYLKKIWLYSCFSVFPWSSSNSKTFRFALMEQPAWERQAHLSKCCRDVIYMCIA